MDDILCDISAFRYHRTPPQVIALCPPFPANGSDHLRHALKAHPFVGEIIGLPVHLLTTNRQARTNAACIKHHLITGELPFGSLEQTPLNIDVASPLLTLFQMGRHIPETHLIMAMYEFCGWFTTFRPSPAISDLLETNSSTLKAISSSWRRVNDANGRPTDLWQRPPLTNVDELQRFASFMHEFRGGRTFYRAAQRVTGITASPFEAQASMLLALPRKRGGEGFEGLQNNQRIVLSKPASIISGQRACYADILLANPINKTSLVIECQGKVAHDNSASAISDSNRATALQQMGHDILLLSYPQISRPENFDIIRKMIAAKLGVRYRQKGRTLVEQEHTLRRDLFIDWNLLGSWNK